MQQTNLTDKQQKLAKLAIPYDKIDAGDLQKIRKDGKKNQG
jgi:hypothetical protein